MKNTTQGFTFVELMTVIAIIGILASATVYGLTGARENAKDKSAMASMQSFLLEASLYRTKNSSYAALCNDTTDTKAHELVEKVEEELGAANVTCHDNANGFVFYATLHSGDDYCVDSTNFAGYGTESGGSCS